jgi:hypothetical protein
MPSAIEDFDFIARRAREIRAARYLELGVSPPASPEEAQAPVPQAVPAPERPCGFKYAHGFEHLAKGGIATGE